MKRLHKVLPLILIVAVIAGCATVGKTAYNIDAVTVTAIDTSMKMFADLVVAGKVPQPIQDQVKTYYPLYQKSMILQITATQAYLAIQQNQAATQGDVATAKAEAERRIQAASLAILDLVDALSKAGVPQSVLPKSN